MADHRAVVTLPPVTREQLAGDAVATAAVPEEHAARPQDARELRNDSRVVSGLGEKPERREEVDDRVEAAGPRFRQATHVAAGIAERRTCASFLRTVEKRRRVVESIDPVTGLGEEVCMPSLPARYIQDASTGWQLEDFDEARNLASVATRVEDRLVFEEVLLVEIRGPPVAQKKTGSRYAPNTSSIAARIS